MEICPTEIWMKIFAFACTDDGTTGNSLALVSRYVHDASQPVRFQRVVLPTLEAMLSFASMLERLPAHRRCVRALDMAVDMEADDQTTRVAGLDSHSYLGSLEGKGKSTWSDALPFDDWLRRCRVRGMLACDAIYHILSMVAPYLRDLSIWFNSYYDRTFIFLPSLNLPALVRFAFRGDRLPAFLGASQSPCCPSLQEMTIVWDYFPADVSKFIAQMAPRLRDLRIVCQSPSSFLSIVGTPKNGEKEREELPRWSALPESLEKLSCRPMIGGSGDNEWCSLREALAGDPIFCIC